MKKVLKLLIISVVVFFVIMLIYLNLGQYQASTDASQYANDYGISHEKYLEFNNEAEQGLIFYTGAKVQPASYSYLADVEDANIYIIDSPFNFPMLALNYADIIIDEHPEIDTWYLGGHSLGGVVADLYANNHLETISGLIFLGSYPASEVSNQLPYLTIYATNDGLVGNYDEYKDLFTPENTEFEVIEGGNHSQFGDYGFQNKDLQSAITMQSQHEMIINSITQFIN